MPYIRLVGKLEEVTDKKEVSISLWDAKANRAKGKSEEARMLNQELDNAKFYNYLNFNRFALYLRILKKQFVSKYEIYCFKALNILFHFTLKINRLRMVKYL